MTSQYAISGTYYTHASGTSTIWKSSNGTTWTSNSNSPDTNLSRYTTGQDPTTGKVYISPSAATTANQAWTTTDGTTFTNISLPMSSGSPTNYGGFAVRKDGDYIATVGTGYVAFSNYIYSSAYGNYTLNSFYTWNHPAYGNLMYLAPVGSNSNYTYYRSIS
jgi:hypothetical protein